ncbi:MAG: stage V sporulation T C-terminal domain-containing protein [Lachnospiraceae bacterium]|nr:stage V sporulation T C-terminal domain-containing protein [Lachnospiraceae bacterium]
MKATGIVRRIDDLGRIVVPKEIRRTLRIREGDPLEIFTNREGEIMLKKYSPIGELGEFAACYAQALAQTVEALVCISDRDYIIAAAGTGRKEVEGEHLSSEVEALIEQRGTYLTKKADEELPIVEKDCITDRKGAVVSSIICNGDCQGSVIMVEKSGEPEKLEVLKTLAIAASNFLGKNMEQ